MQDMISQLIEMDKKAREVTEQVQKDKIASQNEVVSMCEKIRSEYLDRARTRLKTNEKIEKEVAEQEWKKIQSKHIQISERLDKNYNKHCDDWVTAIVNRVIGVWQYAL